MFRALYSEAEAGCEEFFADTVEDYNFVVDSLEEEHVRRAVHTTKTNTDNDGEDQVWVRSTDIKREIREKLMAQ